MRIATRLTAALAAVIAGYFLFAPVPVDPVAWAPLPSPGFTGPFAKNAGLSGLSKLADGFGVGPETVTVGPDGYLYAGLKDGRILRVDAEAGDATVYADTGSRPNGLAFDSAGHLFVGDSFRGLLSVSADGSVLERVTQVDGEPLVFTDDVAIAADGTVWFTEGSRRFPDGAPGTYEFMEGRATGRLISFDPSTSEVRVRLQGLRFANGVAFGPDDDFVLVNESLGYRTKRLWLRGPREGSVDVFFENYPAAPDNIRFNGRDLFWVAFFMPREALLDAVHPYPFAKKVLARIPSFLLPTTGSQMSFIVALDLEGRVVHNLQDWSGVYRSTTSVVEVGDMLFLGSVTEDSIGRLETPH